MHLIIVQQPVHVQAGRQLFRAATCNIFIFTQSSCRHKTLGLLSRVKTTHSCYQVTSTFGVTKANSPTKRYPAPSNDFLRAIPKTCTALLVQAPFHHDIQQFTSQAAEIQDLTLAALPGNVPTLTHLEHLTGLNLDASQLPGSIKPSFASCLTAMPVSLLRLHVIALDIDWRGTEQLHSADLKSLTSLQLIACQLSWGTDGFSSLRILQCLSLKGSQFKAASLTLLNLTQFTNLDLTDTRWSWIPHGFHTKYYLRRFASLPNLVVLKCSDCDLFTKAIQFQLPSLKAVESDVLRLCFDSRRLRLHYKQRTHEALFLRQVVQTVILPHYSSLIGFEFCLAECGQPPR